MEVSLMCSAMMRPMGIRALDGLIVFWVLAAGPLCWMLRDGLGPGAGESQGVEAMARWLRTFSWGPVLVVLVVVRRVLGRYW
jgi:hypothetical protein